MHFNYCLSFINIGWWDHTNALFYIIFNLQRAFAIVAFTCDRHCLISKPLNKRILNPYICSRIAIHIALASCRWNCFADLLLNMLLTHWKVKTSFELVGGFHLTHWKANLKFVDFKFLPLVGNNQSDTIIMYNVNNNVITLRSPKSFK